jgi:hypothetical protein
MNGKQTALMTFVGLALLAAIITVSSPRLSSALALGHWNIEENYIPNSDSTEDSMNSSGNTDNTNEVQEENAGGNGANEDGVTATEDSGQEEGPEDGDNNSNTEEDSSHIAYKELQRCLSNIEGEPTEHQVQDCIESNYGGMDGSRNAPIEVIERTTGDEDVNTAIKRVSIDDSEDEDSEGSEDPDDSEEEGSDTEE